MSAHRGGFWLGLLLGVLAIGWSNGVASAQCLDFEGSEGDFFIVMTDAKPLAYPSLGSGVFGPASRIDIPRGYGSFGVDIADMDNDGDQDIVATGNTGEILIYDNDGSGSYCSRSVAVGAFRGLSTYLRVADFDDNGLPDFIIGDSYNGTSGGRGESFIYLQQADGSFAKKGPVIVPGQLPAGHYNFVMSGLGAGDVDGDGLADVVGLHSGSGVYFWKGDGAGNLAPPVRLFGINYWEVGETAPWLVTGIALFDRDGDGDLDIVAGGGLRVGKHFIFDNDGSGQFSFQRDLTLYTPQGYSCLDAYDFDGDGDEDLVLAITYGQGYLYFVENQGEAGLHPAPIESFSNGTGAYLGAIGAPQKKNQKTARELLEELAAKIAETDLQAFRNANHQTAFLNKLASIQEQIALIDETTPPAEKNRLLEDAIDKLTHDLLPKTDGYSGGNPRNDWISDEGAQQALYRDIVQLIENLRGQLAA